MKKLIFFVTLTFIQLYCFATEYVFSGNHHIETNLTIEENDRLIIHPGTNITFANNAHLEIKGEFNFQGSYSSHISFQGVTPIENLTQTKIIFTESASSLSEQTLQYCDFIYLSTEFYNNIKINIEHCHFTQGMKVLDFQGSSLNKNVGGGIYIEDPHYVFIKNNTFDGCVANIGGAIGIAYNVISSNKNGSIHIENNIFENNNASYGAAFVLKAFDHIYEDTASSPVFFNRNTLKNNSATDTIVSLKSRSYGESFFQKNLFVENNCNQNFIAEISLTGWAFDSHSNDKYYQFIQDNIFYRNVASPLKIKSSLAFVENNSFINNNASYENPIFNLSYPNGNVDGDNLKDTIVKNNWFDEFHLPVKIIDNLSTISCGRKIQMIDNNFTLEDEIILDDVLSNYFFDNTNGVEKFWSVSVPTVHEINTNGDIHNFITHYANSGALAYNAYGELDVLYGCSISDFFPNKDRNTVKARKYNWLSFPRIQTLSGTPINNVLNDLTENVNYINVIGENENGVQNTTYDSSNWDFVFDILPTTFYKVNTGTQGSHFEVFGENAFDGTITLNEGKNWVGYWLREPQTLADAFQYPNGQFIPEWEKVKSVKSEDAYFEKITNERDGAIPVNSNDPSKIYLEYGKGYIITLFDGETIHNFDWSIPNDRAIKKNVEEPEYFDIDYKADYEAINIVELEGAEDILEIAVFENDVCVGAAKVETLPMQLLAYTDTANREETAFTFQAVYNGRSGLQKLPSYEVLDLQTFKYEKRPLIAKKQPMSFIKLNRNDLEGFSVNELIRLDRNYPNPFNPTTNISYYTPQDANVSLEIYNIRGQKVQTLVSGFEQSGKHSVNWNGKNNKNETVSSGVYFYRLKVGNIVKQKKMILMK